MSRRTAYTLILTSVVVIVVIMTPTTYSYKKTSETPVEETTQPIQTATTTETLPEPAPEPKIELLAPLKPICGCESRGSKYAEPNHYEADGVTVLRGRVNPRDIGMCQINLDYHEARATSMGLDVFTEEDNIKYANWLYTTQGSTPWNWSKHCWQ